MAGSRRKSNGDSNARPLRRPPEAPIFMAGGESEVPSGFLWTRAEQIERLPAEEIARMAPLEGLDAEAAWAFYEKERDRLTDYQRWLIVLRLLDLEDFDPAYAVLAGIVESPQGHPALDYAFLFTQFIHGFLRPAGRLEEALTHQRRLLNQYADPVNLDEIRLDEAVLCIEAGHVQEGRRRFLDLYEQRPGDPLPRLAFGEALIEIGRLEEAEQVLIEAEEDETLPWEADSERLEALLDLVGQSRRFQQTPQGREIGAEGAYYGLKALLAEAQQAENPDQRAAGLARFYALYEAATGRFPEAGEMHWLYRHASEMDESEGLNALERYLSERNRH